MSSASAGITKKKPGRKKAVAIDLLTFKCNPAISVRVSSIKKEKDLTRRKEMVSHDLKEAIAALKQNVLQRFKPYLHDDALRDILENN